MNGYNFTAQVRRALAMAREEAVRLRHPYVGTEHILLGLIADGEGIAIAVLQAHSLDPQEIRTAVENAVKPGKPEEITGPDLPYTSRAKKVLELAMSAARDLDHSYVGTEHLLIGLVHEEQGIAAHVLRAGGVTLDGVRAATRRALAVPENSAASTSALLESMRATRPAPRVSISIEVHDAEGRLRHRVRFDGTSEALAFLEALRLARGE